MSWGEGKERVQGNGREVRTIEVEKEERKAREISMRRCRRDVEIGKGEEEHQDKRREELYDARKWKEREG